MKGQVMKGDSGKIEWYSYPEKLGKELIPVYMQRL